MVRSSTVPEGVVTVATDGLLPAQSFDVRARVSRDDW
jgi:hypothetical protein